ncbi:MAG TPA: 2'-5' RNA ligase family protein [Bryobacteraceae bacterium]|nr:2'-5' RNA ligase family protein [Bryobacteraceae bacterium]
MSSTQMARAAAPVFTLVAYLPDPLGGYLNAMREALPGHKAGNVHLTLLPPRPVAAELDCAFLELEESLGEFDRFEVSLTDVTMFEDTGVVYIAVDHGQQESRQIHKKLNRGTFAFQEPFDYKPHITLVRPVDEASRPNVQEQAIELWQRCPFPRKFELAAVDFLRQAPDGKWEKLWQKALGESLKHL